MPAKYYKSGRAKSYGGTIAPVTTTSNKQEGSYYTSTGEYKGPTGATGNLPSGTTPSQLSGSVSPYGGVVNPATGQPSQTASKLAEREAALSKPTATQKLGTQPAKIGYQTVKGKTQTIVSATNVRPVIGLSSKFAGRVAAENVNVVTKPSTPFLTPEGRTTPSRAYVPTPTNIIAYPTVKEKEMETGRAATVVQPQLQQPYSPRMLQAKEYGGEIRAVQQPSFAQKAKEKILKFLGGGYSSLKPASATQTREENLRSRKYWSILAGGGVLGGGGILLSGTAQAEALPQAGLDVSRKAFGQENVALAQQAQQEVISEQPWYKRAILTVSPVILDPFTNIKGEFEARTEQKLREQGVPESEIQARASKVSWSKYSLAASEAAAFLNVEYASEKFAQTSITRSIGTIGKKTKGVVLDVVGTVKKKGLKETLKEGKEIAKDVFTQSKSEWLTKAQLAARIARKTVPTFATVGAWEGIRTYRAQQRLEGYPYSASEEKLYAGVGTLTSVALGVPSAQIAIKPVYGRVNYWVGQVLNAPWEAGGDFLASVGQKVKSWITKKPYGVPAVTKKVVKGQEVFKLSVVPEGTGIKVRAISPPSFSPSNVQVPSVSKTPSVSESPAQSVTKTPTKTSTPIKTRAKSPFATTPQSPTPSETPPTTPSETPPTTPSETPPTTPSETPSKTPSKTKSPTQTPTQTETNINIPTNVFANEFPLFIPPNLGGGGRGSGYGGWKKLKTSYGASLFATSMGITRKSKGESVYTGFEVRGISGKNPWSTMKASVKARMPRGSFSVAKTFKTPVFKQSFFKGKGKVKKGNVWASFGGMKKGKF